MEDEDVPVRGKRQEAPAESGWDDTAPEDMPEEEFIAFVNSQTEYMKGYLRIGAGKEINFYELEEALKGYTQVYLSLLNMVNLARIEAAKIKEEFDMWYFGGFTGTHEHCKHVLSSLEIPSL